MAMRMWGPLRHNRARDYRANPGNFLNVVGRLKPSVSVAAAEAEMAAIASQLEQAYPSNKGVSVRIVPLREQLTGRVSTALWALFAAVGVLLLIACANFAGLLLARSASRRPEMALRASLGAGRSALVRQQIAESLMLWLAGGAIGMIVARVLLASMMTLAPADVGQIGPISLDGRVLLYTLGVAVLTGLVFGLAPSMPPAVRRRSRPGFGKGWL